MQFVVGNYSVHNQVDKVVINLSLTRKVCNPEPHNVTH